MYFTKNNVVSAFFESTDCPAAPWPQLRVSPHLILLSTSLFIILEDVVPDVVLGVDEQLLGVPLLLPSLHPHHEEQDHGCNGDKLGQLGPPAAPAQAQGVPAPHLPLPTAENLTGCWQGE